jgi:hypothetical protein
MKTGTRAGIFPAAALLAIILSLSGTGGAGAWEGAGPLIIEHTCTDLSRIPTAWIDSTKSKMRMYYGHTSHGEQVTEGLRRIDEADPFFAYAGAYRVLPAESGTFCVNDDFGVSPALYCMTSAGMDRTKGALNSNPTINISMFMWCVELNTWTAEQVEEYFDSTEVLEAEFPHVTFIYTTGNAQYASASGYNRWLRNEQIRAYCITNDKVLFDFGDMDAWWYNPATPGWEQDTYEYDGHTVPIEHSQYYGDEWGHTTFESCEVKGRAMWWLATMLSGWYADPTGTEETSLGGLKMRFRQR